MPLLCISFANIQFFVNKVPRSCSHDCLFLLCFQEQVSSSPLSTVIYSDVCSSLCSFVSSVCFYFLVNPTGGSAIPIEFDAQTAFSAIAVQSHAHPYFAISKASDDLLLFHSS